MWSGWRGLFFGLVCLGLLVPGSAYMGDESQCSACVENGSASWCVPDDFFHDCEPRCYPNSELHGFFGGCKDYCFGGYQYQDHWDCKYDSEWGVFHLILRVILGTLACMCCTLGFCAAFANVFGNILLQQGKAQPPRAYPSLVSPLLVEKVEDWMRAPQHWTNQDLRTDFDRRYAESSRISQYIEGLMSETWRDIVTRDRTGGPPKGLKFLKAQRIEDRKMWIKYLRAKEMVRSKHGLDPSVNEMFLWHGTSYEGTMGISEDGFDLNKCGKNGLMFGRGVYLAECCSKSDEYSTDGNGIYQGTYALLLCRACLGEIFHVEKAHEKAIQNAMSSGDYETVLGDREKSVKTYREFVPYSSDLVYPEYVVLYERVY